MPTSLHPSSLFDTRSGIAFGGDAPGGVDLDEGGWCIVLQAGV